MSKHLFLLTILGFSCFGISQEVWANDSSAAVGLGGLELIQNNSISLEREELYLFPDKVRVVYQFKNMTDDDVETLVSFPIPQLPQGITGHLGESGYPDFKNFNFITTVDNVLVKLDYTERVEINGQDVTKRLKELNWPFLWSMDYDDKFFWALNNKLSKSEKEAFIKEGLLKDVGSGQIVIRPTWSLVGFFTRHQVFPARKTVEVVHEYVPLVGSSLAGNLDAEFRMNADRKAYFAKYCINNDFFSKLDQTLDQGDGPDESLLYTYFEHWLSYILKSGANWRGPIKDFRLVIDKGAADTLMSTCIDGLKKIGPTLYELRKTNFEPRRDIDILFVTWWSRE